jgi:hypothetical protein
MKIISDTLPSSQILDSSQIRVINDNNLEMSNIKRITLNVEAGQIATLEIETYNLHNGMDYQNGARTSVGSYCVDYIAIASKEYFELLKDEKQPKKEIKKEDLSKLIKQQKSISTAISQIEI